MKFYKDNNIGLKRLVRILFLCVVSCSVQAAKYEGQEESLSGFDAEAFSESIKSQEKNTVQELKKNYLEVLILVKDKKFIQAHQKVSSLISESPKQSLYYNLKALLQLLEKDNSAAEKSFIKAIELHPQNIQAHNGIAKIALMNKKYVKAGEHAKKVLEINSYSIEAYQIMADVVMKNKGARQVESFLLDAQNKVKDKPEAELGIIKQLGKLYHSQKRTQKVVKLAADLVAKDQNYIDALSFLAYSQLTNKEDLAAEATLKQLVALDAKDVKHRILLVRILDKQKNKEAEMLELLDQAAKNKESLALVLSYKTAVLIKQGQYNKALVVANKVDQANENKSLGKILLADVYFADKQYDNALKNYKLAYEITPNVKLLDAMLKVLSIQKKPNKKVELLENLLAKDDGNAAIKFRMAIAYQGLKKYEQSVELYEELLQIKNDNVVILNNLAWIYNQQNNPKAIEVAKKAHEIAPNSGTIADTYGYILLKQGKNKKALEVLKQAVVLDPVLVDIQLHLAEAYLANKDTDTAKDLLEKLILKDSHVKHKASRLLEML